jgi:DnaK suppressor protein
LTKKPAHKTASKKPAKPAAKKATAAAKKPAPSAAGKAKAKPPIASKKVSKPAPPAKKAGAKPSATKAVKKPMPEAKPKSAAKAAPKAGAAPAKTAGAAKPAAHPAATAGLGVAVIDKPRAAPPPLAPAPAKRLTGRALARANAAPAQAPLPPPTSRFADRFAPPRPPTRQMAQVELDTPRRVHVSDPKLANAWKSKAGRDMTQAEILAMPDSEYMNDKQLEFFRTTLQALKDSLLSNAGETTEHLREDTSIVPDPADRATIEEEHALELRTRDRERKLLKKISQSLARIEAGEYGFCDETGEPIGLARLIARPTATLSLEAQQRRELKQKMFGD